MTQRPLTMASLSRTMGFATFTVHTLGLTFEEIFQTILVEGFLVGSQLQT